MTLHRLALIADDQKLAGSILAHLTRHLGRDVPRLDSGSTRSHLWREPQSLILLAGTPAEADRVLRDAMADAGTALIRRWLVWSAVATATMLSGAGTGWSKALAWRYRATAALTVLVVAVLGFCATLDLFDLHVTGVPGLPWMGDRPWYAELAGGLAGAVVIPLLLALLWGPFRIAGAVVGVTLAVLLHVTVALVALTGFYRLLEWLTARAPTLVLVLLAVVTAAALVVFVSLLA